MEKRRVILYGNSVILGTVGASLAQCSDLDVVSLAPPLPGRQELAALSPDVIIFDLEAAHPEAALSLLQTRPRLLLIGIDAATDDMLLWWGEQAHASGTRSLVRAIGVLDGQDRPPAG